MMKNRRSAFFSLPGGAGQAIRTGGDEVGHTPIIRTLYQSLVGQSIAASDLASEESYPSFLKADPLCMATWSVLSLWISYCGSSWLAW
jgi:hypothetical protein